MPSPYRCSVRRAGCREPALPVPYRLHYPDTPDFDAPVVGGCKNVDGGCKKRFFVLKFNRRRKVVKN